MTGTKTQNRCFPLLPLSCSRRTHALTVTANVASERIPATSDTGGEPIAFATTSTAMRTRIMSASHQAIADREMRPLNMFPESNDTTCRTLATGPESRRDVGTCAAVVTVENRGGGGGEGIRVLTCSVHAVPSQRRSCKGLLGSGYQPAGVISTPVTVRLGTGSGKHLPEQLWSAVLLRCRV
jgi:hypothetical protein